MDVKLIASLQIRSAQVTTQSVGSGFMLGIGHNETVFQQSSLAWVSNFTH